MDWIGCFETEWGFRKYSRVPSVLFLFSLFSFQHSTSTWDMSGSWYTVPSPGELLVAADENATITPAVLILICFCLRLFNPRQTCMVMMSMHVNLPCDVFFLGLLA